MGAGGFEPPKLKSSRFTVCPHWPLGNTPRFNFYSHSWLPVYLTISPQFCQPIFEKDFYKGTTFSQNAAFAWFLFPSRKPHSSDRMPFFSMCVLYHHGLFKSVALSGHFTTHTKAKTPRYEPPFWRYIVGFFLELVTGVEPATHWLQISCAAIAPH